MNRLVYLLAFLLLLSITANLYMWQKMPTLESHTGPPALQSDQSIAHSGAKQDPSWLSTTTDISASSDTHTPDVAQYPYNQKLNNAKALLRAGQFDQLTTLLQNHLREYPDDIHFLLVEADLIQQTESVSFALSHYYELLEFDLNAAQRTQVRNKITALVQEHAEKLSNINAWDILATFIEPLWQREPDNRNYVLTLAESYAHLALFGPTENILASLLPDDPEVLRIRAILPGTPEVQEEAVTEEPINREEYRSAIALLKVGNQFVVESNLVGQGLELLIDTGATTTVISETIYTQMPNRLKNSGKFLGVYQINTAGGKVDAPIYRFPWLAVGGMAVRDAAVVVMPSLNIARADGLLGMNFLREFDFRIDQQEAVLYLK